MTNTTRPRSTERVRFPDGGHVTVTAHAGTVTVDGHLAGEDVHVTLEHREATEQAFLLCETAHDSLFPTLPWDRQQRIGNAMLGAASTASFTAPTRDDSERVALDGGHADVETVDQHVEVTVSIGQRIGAGVALSAVEADRIGRALITAAHRAHVAAAASVDLEGVETVVDLFHRANETGVPAAALIEVAR